MATPADTSRPKELLDLDKSLQRSRFPESAWALLLVFYTPLGLLLTLLRIFLSFQALLLLLVFPEGTIKRSFLRVFCAVLGIVVVTEDLHKRSPHARLFVSNRLSHVDHVVLHLALDCITVSTGGHSPPLSRFFCHRTFAGRDEESVREEASTLPEFDSNEPSVDFTPYAVQPEPAPTTGRHSVLRFSSWPFGLVKAVQPIALRATRPFGVKLTSVSSGGWWDLLWTLFLPCTVFTVRMLPMEEAESDGSAEEFAHAVQERLAEELGVFASNAGRKHVETWLADFPPLPKPSTPLSVPQGPIISAAEFATLPTSSSSSSSSEMETMVRQVLAVLPHVPHTAIRKDLLRTNSVDITITNLLEGRVDFDPVATATTPPQHHASPGDRGGLEFSRQSASSALSSMQRQLSLEERKRNLIQQARRRYIEKHGIQGVAETKGIKFSQSQ